MNKRVGWGVDGGEHVDKTRRVSFISFHVCSAEAAVNPVAVDNI